MGPEVALSGGWGMSPIPPPSGDKQTSPAAQAVASGHYNRVPLLIGTNHNEGRTFAQGFTALTQQQAATLLAEIRSLEDTAPPGEK